jgi:KamA family protein
MPHNLSTVSDTAVDLDGAYAALAKAAGLLPVKVTPFYQKKVDAEIAALGYREGPLARIVYPTQERITARAPGEMADWVGDRANMPDTSEEIFVQKYADRVLFMPTAECAAHCLYCFRQDVLTDQKQKARLSMDDKMAALLAHLDMHPEVTEVILSGGDPMALSLRDLETIFAGLKGRVPHIRIHTRVPVFAPAIMANEAKLRLIAESGARMIIHSVHPYEICDEVGDLLRRMHALHIPLYNQFPLLRGVNDHADVLVALLQRLESFQVRTISMFVPEPTLHSATYRISYDRMCKMVDEVVHRTPSWMHAFRFCLDSTHEKLRRENLLLRDRTSDMLVFMADGARIVYPDFPAEMDVAGDVETLLWKDNTSKI